MVQKKNTEVSNQLLIEAYEKMLLIRRFEERCGQLYGMGLIGGFCHLYIGQEAVVMGLQLSQQPQDTVITSYRDHAHMIACNMDPRGIMAELTGRASGYSKGKGGSMHMFSKEKKFFGGHGIVGAQVSLGTGLAFAHQYKKDNGVCVAYMGDGAANQGQVYESLNMASLWNLPIVYVVEDNEYAMGTSTKRHAADTDFTKRGDAYGLATKKVNGMDFVEIYEAGLWALEHARTKGPVLLHVKTYRYRGHSMSDPANYRSKDEVNEIKINNDPIQRVKTLIEEKKLMSAEDFKALDAKIKDIMLDTVEFAKTSPEPEEHELYTDILVEA